MFFIEQAPALKDSFWGVPRKNIEGKYPEFKDTVLVTCKLQLLYFLLVNYMAKLGWVSCRGIFLQVRVCNFRILSLQDVSIRGFSVAPVCRKDVKGWTIDITLKID